MDLSKLTVLVVEDSPVITAYCTHLLERLGVGTVLSAVDGSQALEILPHCSPDLLLVDIHMSPMGGIELAEKLPNHMTAPKVIFMSDDHSFDTLQKAMPLGSYGFIVKPPQIDDLRSKIELALLVSRVFV